mgnify:FL=1
MLKYIAKRIGLALITIFTVATLTFFLMNMVPGGPFLSEKAVSPAAQAALEAKYGLDKPLSQQYLTYMKDALHGDFGESLKQRGRTVTSIIVSKFPVSARVGGLSVIVALLVGIPLGCLAATHRGKTLDSVISVISTCGIAVPSFVICTLLLYFLGSKVKILPTYGIGTWKHYVMPVIALALYPTAYIMRLMRSSMLDVLGQDYMRTATAKGVKPFFRLFKHALRNALIPVITYLGPQIAFTLCGGMVVEQVFSIPGLGRYFIQAIQNRDYPLIMGTTIFLASFIVIMNLIVDLCYKLVDPRINLAKGGN